MTFSLPWPSSMLKFPIIITFINRNIHKLTLKQHFFSICHHTGNKQSWVVGNNWSFCSNSFSCSQLPYRWVKGLIQGCAYVILYSSRLKTIWCLECERELITPSSGLFFSQNRYAVIFNIHHREHADKGALLRIVSKRSKFFYRINKNDKNIYFLIFHRKNVHFVTRGSEI